MFGTHRRLAAAAFVLAIMAAVGLGARLTLGQGGLLDRAAQAAQPAVPNSPANAPAAARPTAAPTTAPDLSRELAELEKKWLADLGEGHAGKVRSPFLVIVRGDEALADNWLKATILPAAVRIQKQFMKAAVDKPLTILLFPNQTTYRDACKRALKVDNPPYYGFFRPWERLLVMDISTGGGTLVHELTHALIAFDFPDIPDWFNEGLGSLYEQCTFEGDKIRGLPNWRLPALQKVIKEKNLGMLEELAKTDFRGAKMGLNYAQARYLCFYMQQHNSLESFYRAFRDGYKEDPTGLKFLRKTFEPQTLEEVDKDYRAWVLTLRFP